MKTVLITGCSKGGIGYFLCEEFVKAGCKVFASARRLEAMRGLDALGCTLLQLDVQSEASCKKAVQAVIAEAGHIDVLVNNAGVAYSGPLAEAPLSEVRGNLEVNLVAPLHLTQLVVPHMVQQGTGTVVNVLSGWSYTWYPFSGVYCTTKWALRTMTNILRTELLPLNIDVVAAIPGFTATPMLVKAEQDSQTTPSSLGYDAFFQRAMKGISLWHHNAADPRVFARKVAQTCSRAGRPPRHVAAGTGLALAFLLDLLAPVWFEELVYAIMCGFWPRQAAVRKATAAREAAARKKS